MILLFLFILPGVIVGIIIGLVKIIKIPMPPAGSSREYIEWWYNGGWEKEQELKELERLIEEDKKRVNEDVREYLKTGEKMEAIKRYKDYYECSLSKAKTAIAEIEWELEYERYRAEKDAADQLVDTQNPEELETSTEAETECMQSEAPSSNVSDYTELIKFLTIVLIPFLGIYLVLKEKPFPPWLNIVCIIYCVFMCCMTVVVVSGVVASGLGAT